MHVLLDKDFMIWPWIERAPAISLLTQDIINISFDKLPILVMSLDQLVFKNRYNLISSFFQLKWSDAMKKDEAVQESYIAPEYHCKYLMGHLSGSPDYDMEIRWHPSTIFRCYFFARNKQKTELIL